MFSGIEGISGIIPKTSDTAVWNPLNINSVIIIYAPPLQYTYDTRQNKELLSSNQ